MRIEGFICLLIIFNLKTSKFYTLLYVNIELNIKNWNFQSSFSFTSDICSKIKDDLKNSNIDKSQIYRILINYLIIFAISLKFSSNSILKFW